MKKASVASGDCNVMRDRTKRPPKHRVNSRRERALIQQNQQFPTRRDRYLVTVISAASQSTGRDVAGGIYGHEHRPSYGAVMFPPCERAHGHIPLHATPASSGIRPGLQGLGLSQGQPRGTLLHKKVCRKPAAETGTECGGVSEYGSRGCSVLDGRCQYRPVGGKASIRPRHFKIRRRACLVLLIPFGR